MDAFLVLGMMCYLALGGAIAYVGGLLVASPGVEYELVAAL